MQRAEIIAWLPALIRQVRSEIRWRPGSAARHLLKRRLRGHLPYDATIDDYHAVIRAVLNSDVATVFLYWYDEDAYPTVVADLEDKTWLVMFSLGGRLESAFVVENSDAYLSPPEFERIGSVSEVLR